MTGLARIRKKKAPMTQQERSARSSEKRKALNEVELRLSVVVGTRALLSELMEWSGIEEQAEAITLAIRNLHGKGRRRRGWKRAGKRRADRPEEIRMRARPGTMQAMAELMEWAGISDRGEFVEALIKRLHALGGVESIPLLSPPRHKYEISENVARKLEREGRKESILIGLDE